MASEGEHVEVMVQFALIIDNESAIYRLARDSTVICEKFRNTRRRRKVRRPNAGNRVDSLFQLDYFVSLAIQVK